jgi:MOSC domain-containing protein YiiM
MKSGKVLALYMTLPDLMRSGHRTSCEAFECDSDGIIGDDNYETSQEYVMLLTCQSSYDIAQEADIPLDSGILLENIHVDIDLYDLEKGSVIEIGETMLEVTGSCTAFGYLALYAPELTELLENKRGLFVRPLEHGQIAIDDEVTVLKS